jgi:hypothetical protein
MKSSLSFWRTYLILGFLLSGLAYYQTIQQGNTMGIDILHSKWLFLLGLYILAAAACVLFLFQLRGEHGQEVVAPLEFEKTSGKIWQVAGELAVPLSVCIFLFIKYRLLGGFIPQAGPSLWLLWGLCLGVAAALKAGFKYSWAQLFALVFLVQGVALAVISFIPAVSTYPFSLEWSESSRYYYGSLIFASRIYGQAEPLSILHPTRYFMQSVPYLVNGLPIWAHRLWQVLLWVCVTGITAYLFTRRLRIGSRMIAALAAMWFFLYLLQGAVYYHLQVMIWIILLGVSMKHPWRSLLAVLLASAWAGMSRVNWFPVPAMLAIGLYLLEEPLQSYHNSLQYLLKPTLWFVVGTLTALVSQSLYILWSGNSNNLAAFGSSFTSDLIWKRLWPNSTFPLGVVPGIVIVSVPLIVIIIYALWGHFSAWHPIRLLGLAAMLVVLFAGGLVVSVKIGGGGDLHNMDAYMVLLGIIGGYLYFDRAVLDEPAPQNKLPLLASYFALIVPVGFAIVSVALPKPHDTVQALQDLQTLKSTVTQAAAQGKQVLFINQRHLLADGDITSVPLIPEYELVTLNEMAMSDNRPYLNQFYIDLHNHRFGMIVVSAQNTQRQPSNYPFAAENNIWLKKVATPLLCEYQVQTAFSGGVVIMTPRQTTACP